MNTNRQNLVDLLTASYPHVKFKGNTCLCPFHNDKSPSGGIYEKNGIWKYHCFVCSIDGDYYNIKDKIDNVPAGTSFKAAHVTKPIHLSISGEDSTHTDSQIENDCSQNEDERIYSLEEIIEHEEGKTVNEYTNPETDLLDLIVVRLDYKGPPKKKKFIQYTPCQGGFTARGLTMPPLFNRKRLISSSEVIIVEGEKCVRALHKIGIVATTKPGGAVAAEKADWSPVYGKTVILWPDNDSKGQKYMQSVKNLLLPHCHVKWIDPKKYPLQEKGDAYDFCVMCKWEKALCEIPILEAEECNKIGEELFKHLGDVAAGRIKNISLGWKLLTSVTQALIPGTTTFLCGEGGHGKSLMSTQAMQYWHENNIRWCMFELEKDRNFHLTRALAQRVGNGEITSFDKMLGNDKYVRELDKEHRGWVNNFGKHIWTLPETDITLTDLEKWCEDRSKDGYRVICIDPVTAAESGNIPKWEADKKFIKGIKKTASKYKNSIVLITHPATGHAKLPSLEGLMGGKMMGNLCDTALWLTYAEDKEVTVKAELDSVRTVEHINRVLMLVKTRSGEGMNWRIGYWFSPKTLTFEEKGLIKK